MKLIYSRPILRDLSQGARIAFARQFKAIDKDDLEFQNLKKNFINLSNKYKNFVNISFIFDRNFLTEYKDSPIDKGKDIFLKLFKERITL